jgi:hypothetical protein
MIKEVLQAVEDRERPAFEKAFVNHPLARFTNGDYSRPYMRMAFEGWCARSMWDDQRYQHLRNALVGIVGVDGEGELKALNNVIAMSSAPIEDKFVVLEAIKVLLETLPKKNRA